MVEEKRLGCKVAEFEIGTEFSQDGGRSWWVVRTEPAYLSQESTVLRMMIAPRGSTGLSAWEEFQCEENEHALLEPDWKG